MTKLPTYLTEGSEKAAKLQERANSINAKIEKAQLTIEKYQKQFDRILAAYKSKTEYHSILPYEVFANFQPTEDRGWDTSKYNKDAKEMLRKATEKCDNSATKENITNIQWDFFDKAAGLFYSIEEKKAFIEEQQAKLKDIATRIASEEDAAASVRDLFEQVPELAKFIEECGERQYAYFVDFNEKLRLAWEKYYKVEREACDYYNYSSDDWATKNKKYQELRKSSNELKPKHHVRTLDQIRKDVEDWKQSERRFLADRITSEFGKITSTYLYQGADGNVNGTINGSLKTAKIETIWAGGYNIQCLHTRFLVHEK